MVCRTAIYVDSIDKEGSGITHIVSGISSDRLKCLCGTLLVKDRGVIYSALSGTLNLDRICPECVNEANDLLKKEMKLEPNFKSAGRRKRDDINDAIALSKTTKNIAQACKVFNVSRTSHYKYRNKRKFYQEKMKALLLNRKPYLYLVPDGESEIKRIN